MLKSLFIIVLLGKIISSLYSFALGFEHTASPLNGFGVLWSDPIWLWSFTIPFFFMMIYVITGGIYVQNQPQKVLFSYADSCYYLGFLFTIASIIIALTSIRNDAFSVSELAIRFAAAMLTTFVGMAVRLFIFTFDSSHPRLKVFTGNGGTTEVSLHKESTSHLSHSSQTQNANPELEKISNLGDPKLVNENEDINFILQVSCQNLALLNNMLVESIQKFEQLLEVMLNATSRVGNDIVVEGEALKSFHQQLQDKTKELDDNWTKLMERNLTSFVETTTVVKKQIQGIEETSLESLNKISAETRVSLNSLVTSFEETLKETSNAQIKKQEELVLALLNEFKDKLKQDLHSLESSLAIDSSPLQRSIKDCSEVLHAQAKDVTQSVDSLQVSLEQFNKDLELFNGISNLNGLAYKIDELQKTISDVTDSLNKSNEEIRKSSEPLRINVQRVEDGLNLIEKETRAKVDDEVNQVKTKLQSVALGFEQSLGNLTKEVDELTKKKVAAYSPSSFSVFKWFKRL